MYSDSHITMGTSSDDLFDKSGKNQNSLHYKYNKFLVSPYLPRIHNHSRTEKKDKQKFDDNKENELDDDSFGETHIYYPKPNTYNSIYTQKFSKKYKNLYNNPNIYGDNKTFDNNINNYMYKNIPMRINYPQVNVNPVRTPYYQIKKEIEYQRTPNKNNNNISYDKAYNEFEQNNMYNNYKRYDDYYSSANKNGQRYKSPNLSKIALNNFFNQDFNYNNHLFSPGIQNKKNKMYSLDKYS